MRQVHVGQFRGVGAVRAIQEGAESAVLAGHIRQGVAGGGAVVGVNATGACVAPGAVGVIRDSQLQAHVGVGRQGLGPAQLAPVHALAGVVDLRFIAGPGGLVHRFGSAHAGHAELGAFRFHKIGPAHMAVFSAQVQVSIERLPVKLIHPVGVRNPVGAIVVEALQHPGATVQVSPQAQPLSGYVAEGVAVENHPVLIGPSVKAGHNVAAVGVNRPAGAGRILVAGGTGFIALAGDPQTDEAIKQLPLRDGNPNVKLAFQRQAVAHQHATGQPANVV